MVTRLRFYLWSVVMAAVENELNMIVMSTYNLYELQNNEC